MTYKEPLPNNSFKPSPLRGLGRAESHRAGRLNSGVRLQMTDSSRRKKTPKKLLGDAGEHYALSQLSFAGNHAAKMPDNWEAYDLAVETGHGLVRVSVKTRSETDGWAKSRWFNYDERRACDWLVLVFKSNEGKLRSWVIPFELAREFGNIAGPKRKQPWSRDVSWAKLQKQPFSAYEDNWSLSTNLHERAAT